MCDLCTKTERLRGRYITLFSLFICSISIAYSQVIHIDDAKTQYTKATPHDSIAQLQSDIDHGKVSLHFDKKFGYLPALLNALHISSTSQVVVFSKTSVQKDLISPETPREIYFNDRSYVGHVPDAKALELCTTDPYLGAVYYTLLQHEVPKPRFFRSVDACFECHADKDLKHLPQHLMLSAYCNSDGEVLNGHKPEDITDSTPIKRRFGGWFVTGSIKNQSHLGNSFAKQQDSNVLLEKKVPTDITDLKPVVDTSQFLTPYSDIVALMTLAHQYRVQNLITDATYQINSAMAFERLYPRTASTKWDMSGHSESTEQTVKRVCEPLVSALLFCDEIRLSGRLSGQSGFARSFEQIGPFDRQKRSLRLFDLNTRLFKYPCSFLIYTDHFDALPAPAKRYVYRRLWQVLGGKDQSSRFSKLSAADRKAIREILSDTKPDFRAYRLKSGGM